MKVRKGNIIKSVENNRVYGLSSRSGSYESTKFTLLLFVLH